MPVTPTNQDEESGSTGMKFVIQPIRRGAVGLLQKREVVKPEGKISLFIY
jgi:hypothetical protein